MLAAIALRRVQRIVLAEPGVSHESIMRATKCCLLVGKRLLHGALCRGRQVVNRRPLDTRVHDAAVYFPRARQWLYLRVSIGVYVARLRVIIIEAFDVALAQCPLVPLECPRRSCHELPIPSPLADQLTPR